MMVSSATGISSAGVRSPFPAGNRPGDAPEPPLQDGAPAGDASDTDDASRGPGLVAGTVLIIGSLLPGALQVTPPPAPSPDSVSQVVDAGIPGKADGTGKPQAPGAPLPLSDLPVVVVEDPLAHIPTVAAIPYLQTDDATAMLSIRTEALGTPGSPEQAEALLDRYAATEPLINQMLVGDTTPSQADSLRRDLGIVPAGVLDRVARAGTRIWVVPQDVTTVPGHLLRPDGRTDRELEKQWRQSLGSVAAPAPPVTVLKVQAKAPEAIPAGRSTDMLAGYPWAGQTVEDMARFQGARTPEEIESYTRLFRLMNPGLRPGRPLAADAEVNVPDLYFHQGQRYSQTRWNDIRFVESELQNHRISGLYVARQGLIVLLDETLPDPSPAQGHRRIALHELGHAVDALAEADASWGPEHRKTLDALHEEALKRQAAGDAAAFITEYARTNASEHYAESFEAYFTGWRKDSVDANRAPNLDADHEVLMARDPGMGNLIGQDIQHLGGR